LRSKIGARRKNKKLAFDVGKPEADSAKK